MGQTSSIKEKLFGDVTAYARLLEPIANSLIQKYPHPDLKPIFVSLPERSITTGPMSMCARLLQDLHEEPNPSLQQAIGTLCLHISTHDDLIDEPPQTPHERAALLYAGNISCAVGMQLLGAAATPTQSSFICDELNRNHLLQQQCVTVLWEGRPQTFADYARGVEHDGALVGIGVSAALAIAHRQDLWPKLKRMCTAYGTALQLLDDIAEVEEDKIAGYHSFPAQEGPPFAESFHHIEQQLSQAGQLLGPDLTSFGELIRNAQTVARILQQQIQ